MVGRYNKRIDNVWRIINTYRTRHITTHKGDSGRPETLTISDKGKILEIIRKKPYITCSRIVDILELDCSSEAIRTFLHNSGYY